MAAETITEMRVFPVLCGPSCLFHVHVHVDQSATPLPIRRDSCESEANGCNFTDSYKDGFEMCKSLFPLYSSIERKRHLETVLI